VYELSPRLDPNDGIGGTHLPVTPTTNLAGVGIGSVEFHGTQLAQITCNSRDNVVDGHKSRVYIALLSACFTPAVCYIR